MPGSSSPIKIGAILDVRSREQLLSLPKLHSISFQGLGYDIDAESSLSGKSQICTLTRRERPGMSLAHTANKVITRFDTGRVELCRLGHQLKTDGS